MAHATEIVHRDPGATAAIACQARAQFQSGARAWFLSEIRKTFAGGLVDSCGDHGSWRSSPGTLTRIRRLPFVGSPACADPSRSEVALRHRAEKQFLVPASFVSVSCVSPYSTQRREETVIVLGSIQSSSTYAHIDTSKGTQ